MAHNYDVGTRAWQPDVTEGWIASEVIEKRIEEKNVYLVFQLENGEVRYSDYPIYSLEAKQTSVLGKTSAYNVGYSAFGQCRFATSLNEPFDP